MQNIAAPAGSHRHPEGHIGNTPLPLPLDRALAHVDRVFGIDRILAQEGKDVVAPYYIQSELGYRRVHSGAGCMHMALCADGRFDRAGYLTQAEEVAHLIAETGARRVLELGSGMGFNSLHLAPQHPEAHFTGIDLLEHHVRKSARKAESMANLAFRQGSFMDLPPDLNSMDLAFAVETLCHASDLDTVARQIAQALAPGGRLLIYDGYRRPDFDTAPEAVRTAARLFEVTTAVSTGFRPIEDWCAALERAGLRVTETRDRTADTIACTRKLHRSALRFFTDWRYRLLRFVLPRHLVLNTVAGLMGPYMIEGATPGTGGMTGALLYGTITAENPR